MTIIVTKSSPVIVRPSTSLAPPTAEHIKLSSFDKALAFSPFTSFLVFDRAIHEPAETVKRALSRALVPYFPIAGRATAAADGELRISCTGDGVSFVSASANCSLEDVKLFDPPFSKLLMELAIDYPEGTCHETDPLLLVQVTEFSCGGYVLGTTWNHAVADGTGMAQFIQAVGDFARGLSQPCVFAVTCGDNTLPELPPLVTVVNKMMVSLEPQGFVYQDITVPWKLINRVKSEFATGGHGVDDEPCTVFEAVVAVMWRCRTRVVMSDPDAPAPLVFAANVRKHVGAKGGYFGNCVTTVVTVARSGEVANGDINDVVRVIKRAKKGIPGQFKDAAGAGEEGHTEEEEQLDVLFGYNAFYVSSWRNLGFDMADMGGGRPARVMCHVELTAVPNCVACMPCAGKDGANVLALCVKEEHADAFVGEMEMLV
ncbi:hypothetical protein HU200_063987 [Digitaria exilis]|uniref:Uncharacterized protein n=1 Tax=Digitaria exilis TaxID=1010633 RepID=A0A835DYK3_9POAL|nr:hypothetical protein HU200_063987 [Digitaria exilis]CAB3486487.1 unnamed protein product [Digitaria exilis]